MRVHRRIENRNFGGLSFALLAGLGAALSSCEPEQTVAVTTTVDGQAGSLRAAIDAANASPGADFRIEIPSATYELSVCGQDDSNAAGDLDIVTAARVAMIATGSNVVIRQTCPGERVLDARGGSLTLKGVTITGGSITSSQATQVAEGGGVRAAGDVTLDGATITGNSATGAPGVSATTTAAAGAARGGGLFVGGSLNVVQSTFSANVARGGVSNAPTTAAPRPATGGAAEGGAAYVTGDLWIIGGTISGNDARGGNGVSAALAVGGGSAGGLARGGGVAQRGGTRAALVMSDAYFAQNTAQGGDAGGMPDGWDPFNPPAGLAPGGHASGGALAIGAAGILARDATVTVNRAVGGSSGPGACYQSCAAPNPPGSAHGGGVASAGATELQTSRLSANVAQSGNTHSGIFGMVGTLFGGPRAPAAGGAVYATGSVTSSGGAYSQNSATMGSGLDGPNRIARGGAIASDADVTAAGGSFDQNATAGCFLDGHVGHGGAISGAELSIDGATFTSNSSCGEGGAVYGTGLQARAILASSNTARGLGGGAVFVEGDAHVTLSAFRSNSVDGLFEKDPQVSGGGALRVSGHLDLIDTSILDSTSTGSVRLNGGELTYIAAGGGVHVGSLRGEKVTIASNLSYGFSPSDSFPLPLRAKTGGGAIFAAATVKLINATLLDNRVEGFPGAPPQYAVPNEGAAVLSARLELEHATIANNVGAATLQAAQLVTNRSAVITPVVGPTEIPLDVCGIGVVVDSSNAVANWFSDDSCGLPPLNHQVQSSFLLGPLADNGGAVPTTLPGPGSVLIDQITLGNCLTPTDARGVTRPQGPYCDIGAVEQ